MVHPLLLLATPIFGLSLQLDPAVVVPGRLVAQIEAQLELAAPLPSYIPADPPPDQPAPTPQVDPDSTEPAAPSDVERAAPVDATQMEPVDTSPTAVAASAPPPPSVDIAEAMARRARIARVHKWMGIATWSTTTLAVIFGTIQYRNQYGFFASRENTPCDRGDAVGGTDACVGTPVPHLITAALAGATYTTTFALSFAMPDPIGLDRGNSASARHLRTHKRLRWAHFSMMVSQIVLGALVANSEAIGLDRANDYRALQALATVHLLSGYSMYGLLTWSGAIMIRR